MLIDVLLQFETPICGYLVRFPATSIILILTNIICAYLIVVFGLLFLSITIATDHAAYEEQLVYVSDENRDTVVFIVIKPLRLFFTYVYQVIFSFFLYETLKATRTSHFLPLFITSSIFILLLNVVGILPYSSTLTAQLIGTFTIALINFIVLLVTALVLKTEKVVCLVTPKGLSFSLLNFLVFIETISFFSRLFSLALRLFANMTAGHALTKILVGFVWSLSSFYGIFVFLSIMPLVIVALVLILEFVIAFLQAYVFITLVLIYFSELYADSH
jgi:ATP synthase subunit 6